MSDTAGEIILSMFKNWIMGNSADIPKDLTNREYDMLVKGFVGGALSTVSSAENKAQIERFLLELKNKVVQ